MPDRRSFIDMIRANPADDGPRLVYADWLEERGETVPAEYVRVACANNKTRLAEMESVGHTALCRDVLGLPVKETMRLGSMVNSLHHVHLRANANRDGSGTTETILCVAGAALRLDRIRITFPGGCPEGGYLRLYTTDGTSLICLTEMVVRSGYQDLYWALPVSIHLANGNQVRLSATFDVSLVAEANAYVIESHMEPEAVAIDRGLVTHLTASWEWVRDNLDAVLECQPIMSVRLTTVPQVEEWQGKSSVYGPWKLKYTLKGRENYYSIPENTDKVAHCLAKEWPLDPPIRFEWPRDDRPLVDTTNLTSGGDYAVAPMHTADTVFPS